MRAYQHTITQYFGECQRSKLPGDAQNDKYNHLWRGGQAIILWFVVVVAVVVVVFPSRALGVTPYSTRICTLRNASSQRQRSSCLAGRHVPNMKGRWNFLNNIFIKLCMLPAPVKLPRIHLGLIWVITTSNSSNWKWHRDCNRPLRLQTSFVTSKGEGWGGGT